MAKVVLGVELAREFAGGETKVDIEAENFRQMVKALDAKYPGLGPALQRYAVAIDGEIFQEPFLEPVGPDSEVFFLPAIEGG